MSRTVQLDIGAMNEMLSSEMCQNLVRDYTDKAMGKLDGTLYESSVEVQKRAVGIIKTSCAKGYYTELKHNNILKAVRG